MVVLGLPAFSHWRRACTLTPSQRTSTARSTRQSRTALSWLGNKDSLAAGAEHDVPATPRHREVAVERRVVVDGDITIIRRGERLRVLNRDDS